MLKKLYSSYIQSFKGLPVEIWWLSLIMLINRAGAMVIPFLSLYLTGDKGFSLSTVGWIMSAFGLGSVVGAYVGGLITDKIGPYRTMIVSLGISGVLLILTQFAESVYAIALMVFLFILFADMFRPASFTALKNYCSKENQTRSTSLIRLAINLGFSLGPAVGGYLIYKLGYSSLFWVDGITCIIAMLLLIRVLSPRRSKKIEPEDTTNAKPAYKDGYYVLFLVGVMLFGFAFLQYFSTMPLYYKQSYLLNEQSIGLLLGFNGLLIFIIEMPLIHYLEKKNSSTLLFVNIGSVLLVLSFAILFLQHHVWVLWAGMTLMSLSEIVAFPFANSFALNRSHGSKTGQYMGLFSIAFSVSHIFGHNSGFQLIKAIGYNYTWIIMIGISAIATLVFVFVKSRLKGE